jgi:ribosomal protein L24
MHVKRGDKVKVICGDHKGLEAKIVNVLDKKYVTLENLFLNNKNMDEKRVKKNKNMVKIHISNVKNLEERKVKEVQSA